jgi:phosphoribosylaminoimidazolecarboxamide formyltransferase/IMP cyclohydrolase
VNIKKIYVGIHNTEKLDEFLDFIAKKGADIYIDPELIPTIEQYDITYRTLLDKNMENTSESYQLNLLKKGILNTLISEPEEYLKDQNKPFPFFDMLILDPRSITEEKRKRLNEKELTKELDYFSIAVMVAAARNHRNVVIVTDPLDYDDVMSDIEYCGDVILRRRRKLALKALYKVAIYSSQMHKDFSQYFAAEKYDHLTLEHVMQLISDDGLQEKYTLYKLEGITGLLENVHMGNPTKGISMADLNNIRLFMNLYYYTDDISAFIVDGRILETRMDNEIRDIPIGKNTMYASTHIDYSTIKKLFSLGVNSFCGAFDKDAVGFAYQNDISILTVPDRESVRISSMELSGFEEYVVKKERKPLNLNSLNMDDKLALLPAMLNPPICISYASKEESKQIVVSTYNDLKKALQKYEHNYTVAACNVDIDDELVNTLLKNDFKRIFLPGKNRKYSSETILSLSELFE